MYLSLSTILGCEKSRLRSRKWSMFFLAWITCFLNQVNKLFEFSSWRRVEHYWQRLRWEETTFSTPCQPEHWNVHPKINLLDVWIANITAAPSVKRLDCSGNLVLKMVEKFVFHVIIVPGYENLQSSKFWSWLVTSASNTKKETEGPMIMKQTPAKSQPDQD